MGYTTNNSSDDFILKSSNILIVEDSRTQRMLLRKIFEDLGFKNIDEAENGKDALEKTKNNRPDLVILDINMPVMDGFEYCKIARKDPEIKDVAILVQTGYKELEHKAKIFKVGANDYVTKPLDVNEISARSFIHLRNVYNLKELSKFNERVKSELNAARELIQVLLPNKSQIEKVKNKYNIDIAAKFESTHEMGGDFWGFYLLDDERLAIYCIDVSGHGVDSALNALRIHTLLDVNGNHLSNPSELMHWLNNNLVKLFPIGQFATMFYGVIDTKNNCIEYSTAASPSPIIVNKNQPKPRLIDVKGFPLGVVKDADFETKRLDFKVGDTFVLYSDAIIEANKFDGKMFGDEAFVKLLTRSFEKGKGKDMSKVLDNMLKSFHKECGTSLDDDLTINLYHRFA